jgi:hypothetical protein
LNARSAIAFQKAERFVVNILAEDQTAISSRFASNIADKFEGLEWMKGIGGMPILDGCSAYLECSKHSTYPSGDHVVYFGQVEKFHRVARSPLLKLEQDAARKAGETVLSDAEIDARFEEVRKVGMAATAPGYGGVESISAPVFAHTGETRFCPYRAGLRRRDRQEECPPGRSRIWRRPCPRAWGTRPDAMC